VAHTAIFRVEWLKDQDLKS